MAIIFFSGLYLTIYENKEVFKKQDPRYERDWRVTKEGVRYFTTCIDHVLYNAVPIMGGYSLAITHKSCDTIKHTETYGEIKWP
jgi:hypothetical protein